MLISIPSPSRERGRSHVQGCISASALDVLESASYHSLLFNVLFSVALGDLVDDTTGGAPRCCGLQWFARMERFGKDFARESCAPARESLPTAE